MRGRYKLWLPPVCLEQLRLPTDMRDPLVLPNTVVDEGEQAFLRMLLRDVSTIPGGGNFYVGLCDQLPQETDTLSDITSEPSETNGYARLPVSRDVVGWPAEVVVSGHTGMQSLILTWVAAGGDFDAPFSRLFMCDVLTGAVGTLFSYSGALTTPITLPDTQSWAAQYELFLN